MKPMGPIPPAFAGQDRLTLAGRDAVEMADALGTPLFVYDFGVVAANLARLRAAMPGRVEIHYAIKANPMPALLAAMAPLVDDSPLARATAAFITRFANDVAVRQCELDPGAELAVAELVRAALTLALMPRR